MLDGARSPDTSPPDPGPASWASSRRSDSASDHARTLVVSLDRRVRDGHGPAPPVRRPRGVTERVLTWLPGELRVDARLAGGREQAGFAFAGRKTRQRCADPRAVTSSAPHGTLN